MKLRNYLPIILVAIQGMLLSLTPTSTWAAAGTSGASFLNIPVGATPAALGSAYTPLATDAYAPVWNPAGLGFLDGDQVAGQHVSYLESINYEYLSYVHPFGEAGSHGLGLAIQYLTSGDLTGTTDIGAPAGSFSSHYGAYNLAYGQKISENWSIGANGKLINAKIDDVSANAYAADVGSMYRWNDKTRLAATLTNLGTKLTFIDQADSLPMAFHWGAAYKPDPRWLVSAEGIYDRTGAVNFHGGGQWQPMDMISLRVGYRTDNLNGLSPIAGFSTGIGINLKGQEFAYAWVPYGDLGSAQYFSLLLRFGGRQENERRNLVQFEDSHEIWTAKATSDSSASKREDPETQQLLELLRETSPNHE